MKRLPRTSRRATWLQVVWSALAINSLWTFGLTMVYTWQFAHSLPIRLSDGLAGLGLTSEFYFWFNAIVLSVSYFSHFVVAALILFSRPDDRMAVFASVVLLAFGTATASPVAVEFVQRYLQSGPMLYTLPLNLNNLLAWPLLATFLLVYPDGRFVLGWARYIAAFGFFMSLAWTLWPTEFTQPTGWIALGFALAAVALPISILYAQVYRFRYVASPLQRQQIKWFLYGLAVMITVTSAQPLVTAMIFSGDTLGPTETALFELLNSFYYLALSLIPVSVGISILRYRLFDIDLVIRRTLVYGVLTFTLVLVYLGSVVLLQRVYQAIISQQQSEVVNVISTLVIAGLFAPLRWRIQNVIDRRLYRRKYDSAKTLAQFAGTMRDELDLTQLSTRLVHVVEDTLQPEHVSLWLRPMRK